MNSCSRSISSEAQNETSVLILAPYINPKGVGEAYSTFRWVSELSQLCRVTALAQTPESKILRELLPNTELVSWPEPAWLKKLGRLNQMLKPSYPLFCRRVRHWVQAQMANGRRWDVAHQLAPLALRYPSPIRAGAATVSVIGPVAGSLSTPPALSDEVRESALVKFRNLDGLRMRHDPWLRKTYERADLILGAAPYVRALLPPRFRGCFEVMSEVGVDAVEAEIDRSKSNGRPVRLLYVGRLVGTKGLSLLIDALANLPPSANVVLDVVGAGPDCVLLEQRVAAKKLNHVVTFAGRRTRAEVDEHYRAADVFVLPSFREPSGNAVIEAMSWGLPVIVVDYGGPAHAVTAGCGIKIPVGPREKMVESIANAIRQMADSDKLRTQYGNAGRSHVQAHYAWPLKADAVLKWYAELLPAHRRNLNSE